MKTRLLNAWAILTRRPYRYVSVPKTTIRQAEAFGLIRDGAFTPAGECYFRSWCDAALERASR